MIDGLLTAVTDPDPDVRLEALDALTWIGPKAKSAVPTLLAIWNANKNTPPFKDADGKPDSEFVNEIYVTLSELGAESTEAMKSQ